MEGDLMQNSVENLPLYPVPSEKPSLRFYFFRILMRLFRSMQGHYDLSQTNGILRVRRVSEWLADRFMRPPRAVTIKSQVIGQVECEWLIPPDVDPNGLSLVFLHGGGMVFGYGGPHRRLLGRLALDTGMPVLAVDYSVAPESTYPVAHQECWSVYEHLAVSDHEIVLVGESSGAALALATLLRAKQSGLPQPRLCALISPMIDLTIDADSLAPYADPFVHPGFSTGLQKMYWSATQLPNSDLSPVESNLNGLPPLLIMIAEFDILRGEAERLTSTAIEAGVDCRVIRWPHVWHGWHILVGELPEARKAMAAFAREVSV
jgi:acetyl esterase/lipase